MPFLRNRSTAPTVETVPVTSSMPNIAPDAKAPLLNNGRIIMGSFGLKNNNMAKTAGGASHLRFTST
jgi:hypothetical protein